ncbi:MAG TPA: hypothetical protein VJ976_06295 [Ornithinimicrobium sp.]|uniref:hypothetical protein n=1 Tax=Ornithinimicrobium sp. TaxID=1977084 RepID=UPI002B48CEA3|nr:hypothetical protein [Ornithinimicrobium sp.]HKJ11985.1 hypothetical protein [Ornithinimicrobium sp.]
MATFLTLTILSVVTLYALGSSQTLTGTTNPSRAVVPTLGRGVRTLAHLGASWRPVAHMRG